MSQRKKPIIIAITNQKGGEGKTTTAINLAGGLARRDLKTLIVDMDPQANSTSGFVDPTTQMNSMIDLLNKKAGFEDIRQPTRMDNLDLLPSRISLAEFENNSDPLEKPYLLRDALAERQEYDFIIIDCPPSLSIFTINALVTSDYVIIPLQAEKFSVDGIQGLQHTISGIRKRINPDLKILGALITQLRPNTVLTQTILPVIKSYYHIFNATISQGVAVGESHLAKKTVFEYNPTVKQAKEYEEFITEVLKSV